MTAAVVDKVFPTQGGAAAARARARTSTCRDTELALGDDDGWLAVVLSNRLPQPGVRYRACLISLEGQYEVLPDSRRDRDDLRPDRRRSSTRTPRVDELTYAGGARRRRARTRRRRLATLRRAARGGSTDGARAARLSSAQRDGRRRLVRRPDRHAAAGDGASAATGKTASSSARCTRSTCTSIDAGAAQYTFPVLAQWQFTCTGAGDFQSLMQGLDVGHARHRCRRPPPPQAGEQAAAAARARCPRSSTPATSGSSTSAGRRAGRVWYRGPLVPRPVAREQPDARRRAPARSTPATRRAASVPTAARTSSLAAAFEIGRLLALAEPSVVAALLNWRKDGARRQRGSGRCSAREPRLSASWASTDLLAGFGARAGSHSSSAARRRRRRRARPARARRSIRAARSMASTTSATPSASTCSRPASDPGRHRRRRSSSPASHAARFAVPVARAHRESAPARWSTPTPSWPISRALADATVGRDRRGGAAADPRERARPTPSTGCSTRGGNAMTRPPRTSTTRCASTRPSDAVVLHRREMTPSRLATSCRTTCGAGSRASGCSRASRSRISCPTASCSRSESIRFFYLDREWTDALVQGALSVGTVTTLDREHLQALHARHPRRDRRRGAARCGWSAATRPGPAAAEHDHRLPAALARRLGLARAARPRLTARRSGPDDATGRGRRSRGACGCCGSSGSRPRSCCACSTASRSRAHRGAAAGHPVRRRPRRRRDRHARRDDPAARRVDRRAARPARRPRRRADRPLACRSAGARPGSCTSRELARRIAAAAGDQRRAPSRDPVVPSAEFAMEMLQFPFRQVFGDPALGGSTGGQDARPSPTCSAPSSRSSRCASGWGAR